jgi:hypothetical protein
VGSLGPVLRFEVHHYLRRLNAAGRAEADRFFRRTPGGPAWDHEWRPGGAGDWIKLHNNTQAREYDALRLAQSIANRHGTPDAPFLASSYGIGQIMGFHHRTLGYPTARAMFEDAHTLDGQQRQLIGFIAADPRLVEALRAGDFRTFAGIYNAGNPNPTDAVTRAKVDGYAVAMSQAARALGVA